MTPPFNPCRTGWTRREFLCRSTAAICLSTVLPARAAAPARRMKIALSPGAIGVRAGHAELVALAVKHGFEAIEPNTGHLASLSNDGLRALLDDLKKKNLVWAAAGFPLDFRGDDIRFRAGLGALPQYAALLQRAGVTRAGTWISPTHGSMTREQNMDRHAGRLREGARILNDHGVRLGLEYVGTQSARSGKSIPFVFNMAGALELIRAIGQPNTGLILDSWHWWQAGDTVAALGALKNSQIVSVDLNDAPAGVDIDKQQDGKRELPAATGVIDLAAFLNALNQTAYDGPVRAEPFNKALNDLDDEPACQAVAQAMKRAFALLR